MNEPRLVDLVAPQVLQQLQDGFSKFTGLAALITDDKGVPITNGSGFTDFCYKFTRKSEEGLKRCKECDKNGAFKTLRNGKPVVYRCHAGMIDFAAPIMVDERLVGSFIGGQVRPSELDDETLTKIAKELGIEPNDYIMASKRTYIKTMQETEKAAEFLFEITKIISEMAYNNYVALNQSRKFEKAARSQSSYIMSLSLNIERTLDNWLSSAKKAMDSGNNEAMASSFRRLMDESTDVYSTIRDMVGYIQMTGGDVDLSEEEYNIHRLSERIQENVKSAVKKNNNTLKIQISDNLPEVMLGDSGKIGQVISKLILNLSQANNNEEILVSIDSTASSYSTLVIFTVCDTGRGMTKQQLENTRDFFGIAHTIIDDEYIEKMGFPIIAMLIKQMRGKIEVESEEYKGTRYKITIPQLEVRD